jgi:hypothetical protein
MIARPPGTCKELGNPHTHREESMIERTRRPFTDEERDLLHQISQPARGLRSPLRLADLLVHGFILTAGVFLVAMLSIGVLLTVVLLWFVSPAAPRSVVALCLLGPSVIVTACVCWRTFSRRATSEREIEHDLRDGQAEELHVTASEVVELEEFEDEGPGFFFDVGDGRLLFMQGQYLDDYVSVDESSRDPPAEQAIADGSVSTARTPRFPCREFEMVRAPLCGEVLALRCLGDYLSPSRRMSVAQFEGGLPDWIVFEGRLATLEDDVGRVPRE